MVFSRASGSSIKFLGLIDISALIVKASVHDLDKLALLLGLLVERRYVASCV